MTFAEMQTEVFRRLEESSSSPVYWSIADVQGAINEGYEEISDATEWNETNFNVSLTANTKYYDLSSTSVYSAASTNPILTVRRVYNNQTSRWLDRGNVTELDRQIRQWENNTGEPTSFWVRGLWWLGMYPKVAASAGTVTVYASVLPTALSGNTPLTALPQEYHLALVEYACYDLLCQDGEYRKAERYLERYLAKQESLRRFVLQRDVKDRVGAFDARDRAVTFTGVDHDGVV